MIEEQSVLEIILLQLISYFKERRLFSSSANGKPSSYLYPGTNVILPLFYLIYDCNYEVLFVCYCFFVVEKKEKRN